jgi:hypothetical protein
MEPTSIRSSPQPPRPVPSKAARRAWRRGVRRRLRRWRRLELTLDRVVNGVLATAVSLYLGAMAVGLLLVLLAFLYLGVQAVLER